MCVGVKLIFNSNKNFKCHCWCLTKPAQYLLLIMSMALFEVAELFINTLMRAEKAAGV